MSATSARPRLVAIEDQAIVQDLLTSGLADWGYDVVIARDAGAALDLVRQQPAAAVLLDTSMRLDEAWAFACTFRHLERAGCAAHAGEPAPVIAFSAVGGAAEQAAAVEVDDVLPQSLVEPCAIDALVDVLSRHLVAQPAYPAHPAHPAQLVRSALGALELAGRVRPLDLFVGFLGFASRCLASAAGGAMRARDAVATATGPALEPSRL